MGGWTRPCLKRGPILTHEPSGNCSGINKDLSHKDQDQDSGFKDQDKDKDSNIKDNDKDQDLNLVLKESLRTRTKGQGQHHWEIDSYEWDKLPLSNVQLEGRKGMFPVNLVENGGTNHQSWWDKR